LTILLRLENVDRDPIVDPGASMRTSRLARTTVLLASAGLAVAAAAAAPGSAQAVADPGYDVVATGLDNPRHLTFGEDGELFVVEAGRGGDGACITSPEGGQACYGTTGAITRIGRHHSQKRVVTGLSSLAVQDDDPATPESEAGAQAIGPSDVLVDGHRYVIVNGLGTDPANRASLPDDSTLGLLIAGRLGHGHDHGDRDRHGDDRGFRVIADIAGHEADTNPIDDPDSDPVSVLRKGSKFVIADAGGNTVVKVSRHGRVRTIAEFPDRLVDAPPFLGLPPGTQIPMQAVPTSVVRGPDHGLYVSQLTGFPFPQGAANVYRLRKGHAPTVYATGLTNVTDLAFGRDGSLYAVEIASAGLLNGPVGALVRIPRGGGAPATIADGLFAPYGVALHHGSAYVTTGSVAPGGGQVIRIPLG
jgi:hypothetical protein